jgi:hypothetical protein
MPPATDPGGGRAVGGDVIRIGVAPCGCRLFIRAGQKACPVLVEGAAEPVSSADIEVRDLLRIGNRLGERTQRSSRPESPTRHGTAIPAGVAGGIHCRAERLADGLKAHAADGGERLTGQRGLPRAAGPGARSPAPALAPAGSSSLTLPA